MEPIYKRIENHIKGLMKDGKLKEGELLPSENQFCDQFGVSRMTVRSALNNLVAEGYIAKKKGVGSIVISTKIYDNIGKITGFFNEMTEKGYKVSTIVHELKEMEADDEISEKLRVPLGEKLWKIIRVRLANDVKLSVMETYMPVKLFPNITKKHCEGSLYNYIQTVTDLKISSSDRTVEAVLATKQMRKLLGLDFEAPLLHIEQVCKLSNGVIFEYSHTHHHNYKLTLNALG